MAWRDGWARRAVLGMGLIVGMANDARGDDAADSGCALSQSTVEAPESCASCHGSGSGSGHPVDVDYALVASRRSGGMGLRPAHEVVARGVVLADGKVTCLSCHEARSPWRFHIALPPGARAAPGVNPRAPATYDPAQRSAAVAAFEGAARRGERPQVSPKPLCLACHAAD